MKIRSITIVVSMLLFFSYFGLMAVPGSEATAASVPSESVISIQSSQPEAIRPTVETADNDELFRQYVDHMFSVGNAGQKQRKVPRREALTGNDQLVYDALKKEITKVANGELDSSSFSIPLKDIFGPDIMNHFSPDDLGQDSNYDIGEDENPYITEDAKAAMFQKIDYNLGLVIDSLLADCPYELYWYDKTALLQPASNSIKGEWDGSIKDYRLFFPEGSALKIDFWVSADYLDENAVYYTDVDTQKTGATSAAVETAKGIVKEYASLDDYKKLNAYRERICSLTSYNDDALLAGTDYGNPWQIIWVFDNDKNTNVVCEGYTKAFQYLCDISTFESDKIDCRTVSGIMHSIDDEGVNGAGAHMWNIVTMDNQRNYLVDVTNCDAGTIGADDLLFLTGYNQGNPQDGYQFDLSGISVFYTYDEETLNLYDIGLLTLNAYNYTGCIHNWEFVSYEPEDHPVKALYHCTRCQEDYEEDIRITLEALEEIISSLPDKITLDNESDVQAALDAYASLTDFQKAMASDMKLRLDQAESALQKAKEEKEKADKEAQKEQEQKPVQPISPTNPPVPSPVPVNPEGSTGDPSTIAGKATQITAIKNDKDPAGSTFSGLQLRAAKTTKNSVKLVWAKVPGASGYYVFGSLSGGKNKFKQLAVLQGGSRKTWTQKSLKKGTYYKYIVVAYKETDGIRKVTSVSKIIHAATLGGKAGNYKAVKPNKASIVLKRKKSFKIKAKEVPASKKLKVKRYRKLSYESTNPKIASVSSSGKITAKKKGRCVIYIYTQNGVFKRIKVKVK